MLLTQTTALVVDAYRELNARRLFWVTLAISALIVLAFAAVGINDSGFTLFWKQIPSETINTRFIDRATAYKSLFQDLGVNVWLTWGAMLLALVSTANLFPDFLTGGSIDLYLSKPIGRVRLFASKFVAGLLFVALQVLAFCAASFLVLGIRGGVWVPAVFVAVPLVVLIFSYLYAVQTFFGILTRSTIASLLLTIVFWAATVLIAQTNHWLLQLSISRQIAQQQADHQIDRTRQEIETLRAGGARIPSDGATTRPTFNDVQLQSATLSLTKAEQDRTEITDSFAAWHQASAAVLWPLPKTTQTYQMIQRVIGKRMRLQPDHREPPEPSGDPRRDQWVKRMQLMQLAERRVTDIEASQSVSYVVGTSLGFEALVVIGAGWFFWRRDY